MPKAPVPLWGEGLVPPLQAVRPRLVLERFFI